MSSLSSNAPALRPRADLASFILALLLCFAASSALAWWLGQRAIEAMLPLTQSIVERFDDRLAVTALRIDSTRQESVIIMRNTVRKPLVAGQRVAFPDGQRWVQVSTPLLAMLMPLVIAVGLAGAWPARPRVRIAQVMLAFVLGTGWLLLDLPLTLHAAAWDAILEAHGADGLSPLRLWLGSMHAGGRLAAGALIAALACLLARRLPGLRLPAPRLPAQASHA